jgi:hypothetical protein
MASQVLGLVGRHSLGDVDHSISAMPLDPDLTATYMHLPGMHVPVNTLACI